MTFTFKLTDPDLKKIVAHIKANPDCKVAYTDDASPEPALFLVKDQGAYLMSASKTNLPKPEGVGSIIAYAEGHRPEDGWIGGDDFAENIPLKWIENAIAQGKSLAVFILTENEMEFKAV